MYALMWHLTGSTAASFLSGLVFAFSPYRATQLTHLQMLAMFWSPVMLLALHAYLDTRRRGWLALYGLCWLMQAASNGYYLFYASGLVAFWVLWFAVARREWRAVAAVVLTTVVAALPLVPVMIRYLIIINETDSCDRLRRYGCTAPISRRPFAHRVTCGSGTA